MDNINNIFEKQPPKKNIFKYLFLISILLLIFVVISFSFTLNKQPKESLTQQNTKDISIDDTNQNQLITTEQKCEYNTGYFNASKKYDPDKELFKTQYLGFLFPKNTTSIIANDSVISMNNNLYKLEINRLEGPCLPSDKCAYVDQLDIPNIRTLRIWQKDNKTFAINAQDLFLDDKFINLFITKQSSNLLSKEFLYFTSAEIQTWKEILSNPVLLEN